MSVAARLCEALALIANLVVPCSQARAEENKSVQITSGVRYEFIARWDANKLNQVLKTDTPKVLRR